MSLFFEEKESFQLFILSVDFSVTTRKKLMIVENRNDLKFCLYLKREYLLDFKRKLKLFL